MTTQVRDGIGAGVRKTDRSSLSKCGTSLGLSAAIPWASQLTRGTDAPIDARLRWVDHTQKAGT